jgi:hypothetical protein
VPKISSLAPVTNDFFMVEMGVGEAGGERVEADGKLLATAAFWLMEGSLMCLTVVSVSEEMR